MKRDPHDRANKRRKSENAKFKYQSEEVSRLIKLATPRQAAALAIEIPIWNGLVF